MLKFVALAAVLAIGATPAIAQAPSAGTAPPAAKAEDPNKKICERVEETGTRLGGRRVCKTKAEWAAERAESRRELERAQQNADYRPAG
jgi:hypothetical protein